MKISVIIMTLNAERYIRHTIEMLLNQTIPPDEIIIADSQSDDKTTKIASCYDKVKILEIKRNEFDHGGSRDYALRASVGDYILFFTQDAILNQNNYIETIISNFSDKNVAMVYGRQVAKPDAYLYERLIRKFNYPNKRIARTKADIPKMGIKSFYMSDVCSAYRRTAYLKLGGFEYPILTSEDMLIAAHALKKGYKTIYDPRAYVLHSHNLTFKQEFKRNFDVSVFMAMHKKEFKGINVDAEGIRLVLFVSKGLLKHFHIFQWVKFGFICIAKFMGNRKGKSYFHISKNHIKKYSNNINFWRKYYNFLLLKKVDLK